MDEAMDEACPKTELLSARLDEQLSASERAELDNHRAQCELCAGQFAELRQLRTELLDLPGETLGFDLSEVIRGRLESATPRRPVARDRRRWLDLFPWGIGAAASLTLGLSMGMAVTASASLAVAPPIAAMSVFAPIAPGGLCIDALDCTAPRITTVSPLR